MEIGHIIEMPTSLEKNHESILRSYHILRKVMEMVNRGDSKETINELYNFMVSFK